MKWATFTIRGDSTERVGVIDGDQIHAAPPGATLIDCFGDSRAAFAERGEALLRSRDDVHALTDVQLLAPVPRPPSVRDFMMFEEHVINANKGLGRDVDQGWYDRPVFYFTNPVAIVGPDAAVTIAPGSEWFDYELELGAVIGWPAAHADPRSAEELIAGYCLLIDWSARDLQGVEMKQGLGPAKGKDTATSLGPVLVTPDELESRRKGGGYDLGVSIDIDGKSYGERNFADMYWSFGEAIAYASRGTRVVPGDVFGSGTCGQGCILELQAINGPDSYRWLQVGDEVTIHAEVLGELRHTIVAGPEPYPTRVTG